MGKDEDEDGTKPSRSGYQAPATIGATGVPSEFAGEAAVSFLTTYRRPKAHSDLSPQMLQLASSLRDGRPNDKLLNSFQKMQALNAMRRVATDALIHAPPMSRQRSPGSDQDQEEECFSPQEGTLLHNTLASLSDSSAALQWMEEELVVQVGLAADAGGARHASTSMCWRVLEVIRRKRALLDVVEKWTADLDAEIAQQQELRTRVIAGKLDKPPLLMGVLEFVDSMTHPGKLTETSRTDFVGFVQAFKLPREHRALTYLRNRRLECAEWWAAACLGEAEAGTDYLAVRRMHDIAEGAGVGEDHPRMFRARRILIDRVADWALEQAKKAQEKWSEMNSSDGGQAAADDKLATAGEAADAVERHIESAVKEGVSQADPRIAQARKAVKELRDVDFARRRRENIDKRRAR